MGTRPRFVSRAGEKLAAALDHFQLDIKGQICADFGSHAGGFVDCLLQRGAARVYAIDTAYGILAWKLRRDPRVLVLERTNALHVELPELIDLVTIDVGWTRQELILPSAARLLRAEGRLVTLIKPQYEAQVGLLRRGVLPQNLVPGVVKGVLKRIVVLGWEVMGTTVSPLAGYAGNQEVFALLSRGFPLKKK
jgi:23S rRNA (cytidine1920-2'-O)/16S rRNA (cytidine1409-2'-O)-methyltransferase